MYTIKLRIIWLIRDIQWAIKRLFISKEKKIIADIIIGLELYEYYYLKSIGQTNEKTYHINGYEIEKETYCWLIFKPTDIGENPQWKGEDLLMIIPRYLHDKWQILNIVKNSQFLYF